MSDLRIERDFRVSPELVFAFVTQPEYLYQWWGHEDMTIIEHNLDFTQPGPWMSTLLNRDGGRHKMSGVVVAVNPPSSVEFTWGWHDENDQRGVQTLVRFEVSANDNGGARFVLTHTDHPTDEIAAMHTQGWTSVLRSLEKFIQASH